MSRSEEAIQLLRRASLTQFEQMVYDEYASRALQVLSKTDPQFRVGTIKWFVKNWPRSVTSISGVFLLSACIKNTTEQKPLVLVRNALLRDRNRFHLLKSHKRLLYCMAEFSAVEDMGLLCESLLTYNPGV